jgi:hypothetical protein
MARQSQRQIWAFKPSILKIRQLKQIKADGRIESDAETLDRILKKLEEQATQDVLNTKTDARHLFPRVRA